MLIWGWEGFSGSRGRPEVEWWGRGLQEAWGWLALEGPVERGQAPGFWLLEVCLMCI